MLARGRARKTKSAKWYEKNTVSMEIDGEPTKVVIDEYTPEIETDDKKSPPSGDFWNKKEEDGEVECPIAPFLYVFDLFNHRYVDIYVQNLEPYKSG